MLNTHIFGKLYAHVPVYYENFNKRHVYKIGRRNLIFAYLFYHIKLTLKNNKKTILVPILQPTTYTPLKTIPTTSFSHDKARSTIYAPSDCASKHRALIASPPSFLDDDDDSPLQRAAAFFALCTPRIRREFFPRAVFTGFPRARRPRQLTRPTNVADNGAHMVYTWVFRERSFSLVRFFSWFETHERGKSVGGRFITLGGFRSFGRCCVECVSRWARGCFIGGKFVRSTSFLCIIWGERWFYIYFFFGGNRQDGNSFMIFF